ncbi:MAG: response regulator [Magnetococcales bacterium]|nr:response regulator [Magnetococcales bacterium]NGZ05343.1 response regulator [Magnetococcales bacterium]
MRPVLLVVDDTPTNLALVAGLLEESYQIKLATSGRKALEIARATQLDLVLLDIMMPEMDGYEVCRQLKSDPATRNVPVIFLTAKISVPDEELGFAVGAVDFIHKPISPPILMARVQAQLRIREWGKALSNQNHWLQQEVERRLGALRQMQSASIQVMVSLAEFRDSDTGHHIVRTQKYVELMANALYEQNRYTPVLTPVLMEQMTQMAPLHDIGKMAIPDSILLKPGKLDPAELEIMRTHSERGDGILKQCALSMGESGEYLKVAMNIARHHHEKWDGSGYPDGLAGERIPIEARIMAMADVYDALRSRRPYKQPMNHEEAYHFMLERCPGHFDPVMLAVWRQLGQEICAIADAWVDQ